MRKITGKAAAGLLALMMAVSGVPAAGNGWTGQEIVQAAEGEQQVIAAGNYKVPVKSLESSAPLQPVKDAFAKAFGDNMKITVDDEGNQTAVIDLRHMTVDMTSWGMGTYEANVLTITGGTVLSTRTENWSNTNGSFSDAAVTEAHEVPAQIQVPLTAEEDGTYVLEITVDFMDGLMNGGNPHPTDVTLTLDWDNAEKVPSEGAFFAGAGAAQTEVTPGTYNVALKMQKAGTDMDAEDYFSDTYTSMAGKCIDGPASVVIHKDGTATMSVALTSVTMGPITAWASDWKVAEDSSYASVKDAVVEGTTLDASNNVKPNKISFQIPSLTSNGIYVQMDSSGSGRLNNAILAADWANIQKVSDDTSDTSDVETKYNAVKNQMDSVIAEINGLKESDYTAESWKALQTAAEAAKKAVADKVSASELEAALTALNQAKAALKKAEPVVTPSTPAAVKVSTPSSVKAASAAYNKVKISWKKVSGASGYRVYQYNSKTKKYATAATVKGTSYTKSALKTGTKYSFKVRAYKTVNGKTVWSSYSKTVSAKPVPAKVTKVKAVNKAKKSAKISWKKVSGASGYRVYRATKKNGKYKLVKTIKKNKTVTYTNKKLKKGKKYYYKVRAYKTVGKKKVFGKYSAIVKAAIKK